MSANQITQFEELERIVLDIKQIKEDVNTHWESYDKSLSDVDVPEKLDRIVDQLFIIIGCYQEALRKGNGEVIDRAKSARKECVKVGCDILRPIVAVVREKASHTMTLPTVGGMADVMHFMSEADESRKRGLQLAEADEIEGFNKLKKAIGQYEEVERKAKEIIGGHRKATELAFGQKARQQWQLILAILAVIIAVISLIVVLSK